MKTDRYSVAILVADDSGTILYPSTHFIIFLHTYFFFLTTYWKSGLMYYVFQIKENVKSNVGMFSIFAL